MMLGSSGQESRRTGCFCFPDTHILLLILLVTPPLFSFCRSSSLILTLILLTIPFVSSRFQPYNQKEPPVVRVVEGPLFSEVVAHYQHFQQTTRIHNVPGSKCRMQNFKIEPIQMAFEAFCV